MISPQQVIHLIEEHGILVLDEPLGAQSNLFTLGLDSVALMQLLLLLESELGISLSPAEVQRDRFMTPEALAGFLCSIQSSPP